MLMKRVITAIVLLIIFSAAIAFGPLSFAGVMAIAFGAVLFEWLQVHLVNPDTWRHLPDIIRSKP